MMKNFKRRLLVGLLSASMLLSAGCGEASPDSKVTTSTTAEKVTTAPDTENSKLFALEELPESDITPALWKIKTERGNDIYFTGSMHSLPKESYSLPKVIMDVYNSCEAIAVECDTVAFENNFSAQLALSQSLVYSDGTSISDHISPEVFEPLVKQMKKWGIFNPNYTYMKPAAWQALIENYLGGNSDIVAEYGFDSFFLKKAKSDRKKIIEVESVSSQMDMLLGFSDEINEILLSSYLEYSQETYNKEMQELYDVWASGNLKKLEEMLSEEFDESSMTAEEILAMKDYNQQMVHSRNKVMADKLIELSKGDESVFYLVGLAHLVGETGVLALLDEAGVEYERITY